VCQCQLIQLGGSMLLSKAPMLCPAPLVGMAATVTPEHHRTATHICYIICILGPR
jgi:hypothetical protein